MIDTNTASASSAPNTETLIVIAAIAGAFGIKGEVKIKPFTDDPKACLAYGPLRDIKGKIILTPVRSRLVKKSLAVVTDEVKTREQAEAMKSTKLYIYRSELPAPDEDEFYYSDLIGLRVETLSGEMMGKIKAVNNFGAGDLIEIQKPNHKDWLLPFTKLCVPRVDVAGGRIVIDPPEEIEGDADRDKGEG